MVQREEREVGGAERKGRSEGCHFAQLQGHAHLQRREASPVSKGRSTEITLDRLGELVKEGAWRGLQQPPSSGKWKVSQDWRHGLGFPRISDAGKTRRGWIPGLEQLV